MDIVTRLRRSAIMARIGAKNTGPELHVRRLIHSLGYRFRVHRKDLAGTPDLVFSSRRKVIFVHGCFWHSHRGCARAFIPKSRKQFWLSKLSRNRERDQEHTAALQTAGWGVLVVWECELNDP